MKLRRVAYLMEGLLRVGVDKGEARQVTAFLRRVQLWDPNMPSVTDKTGQQASARSETPSGAPLIERAVSASGLSLGQRRRRQRGKRAPLTPLALVAFGIVLAVVVVLSGSIG